MASLRRLSNSPYWIGCFTLPDGTRTQRSTKETDRRKAQKIADAWDDAAREARLGRLTENQARKVIADIYHLATRDEMPSSTIKDYFERWLTRKELESGSDTRGRYETITAQLLEYLGDRQRWDITRLTSKEISGFRDHLAQRLAVGTVNLSLGVIHTALESARRDGLVTANESSKVQRLKRTKETSRRAFTIDELKLILNVSNDEWRGMILAGLYLGQRLGDIANLTWSNVDLQQQEIRLATSKTGRRIVLPIAKPLLKYLETLPAGDDPSAPLFPKAHGQRTGTLSNKFREILVSAGLAQRQTHRAYRGGGRSAKRIPNDLCFHCLRHTATSMLKNAGVSDSVTMDIIGHTSSAVSRVYTHIDEATKRKALDGLPDVTQ